MSKVQISQRTPERSLLTEIFPYETPVVFSNWGSFNYCRNLAHRNPPPYLQKLFSNSSFSIPYKFRIKKDGISKRALSLVHPHNSSAIVDFYKNYGVAVLKYCKRSPISLRAPHHIAKFYTIGKMKGGQTRRVEDITSESAYASSFFCYAQISHLHKFFDSDVFTELEKRYSRMRHLDIARFFPSLYTHSISWAIKGKTRTKESLSRGKSLPSFDVAFDALLQNMNYRETHGIAIGPELCRIFSEVILQKVDSEILAALESQGLYLGIDYWIYRFMDDYFVFLNNPNYEVIITKKISEELEKFKLYLNESKAETYIRPFMSDISIAKLNISNYLSGVWARRAELKAAKSCSEVNKLRSLTRGADCSFSSISSFSLASIGNQIRRLFKSDPLNCFDFLYTLVDLAFFCFRLDVRVPATFKLISIILDVKSLCEKLLEADRYKLYDKIIFEIRGALETTLSQGDAMECTNLLILSTVFFDVCPLSPSLIEQAIACFRKTHNDEYSSEPRMGYFAIVSLIYVIRDRPEYAKCKKEVIEDAAKIIKAHDPTKYAESAYLLLDLVACPHISKKEKDALIGDAMIQSIPSPAAADVARFRNFVAGQQNWYFHWNRENNLRTHLKKKTLLLSY